MVSLDRVVVDSFLGTFRSLFGFHAVRDHADVSDIASKDKIMVFEVDCHGKF